MHSLETLVKSGFVCLDYSSLRHLRIRIPYTCGVFPHVIKITFLLTNVKEVLSIFIEFVLWVARKRKQKKNPLKRCFLGVRVCMIHQNGLALKINKSMNRSSIFATAQILSF